MKLKNIGTAGQPRLIAGVLMVMILIGCASQPPQAVQSGIFTVKAADEVSLQYDVMGEGDTTLLFVHCWTCNRSFWDGQFEAFAENYRVVRLDLAGHGKSGQEREEYSIAGFGADVAAVADQLNLDRMVLIGHSMGGPVTVEAAKLLGDRVIGVVGVDTFYTGFIYPEDDAGIERFVKPFKDDFKETSAGMVRNMFPPATDPAIVERVLNVTQNASRKMAVAAMYDIFYWSRREAPGTLDALGDRLRNINGEPLDKNVTPHPSTTTIPGTGHFVPLEKPAAFNAALTNIVDEFTVRR